MITQTIFSLSYENPHDRPLKRKICLKEAIGEADEGDPSPVSDW